MLTGSAVDELAEAVALRLDPPLAVTITATVTVAVAPAESDPTATLMIPVPPEDGALTEP